MHGYLWIIAAALMWGMIGPFSRLAFSQGVSSLEIAFWRALLSWLLFGGHALIARQTRLVKSDLPHLVAFGLTGVALFYASYQVAVNRGGAALGAVLLYTAPAWVVLLARIFLGEAVTRTKAVALTLTMAGVLGVSLGGGAQGPGLRMDLLAIAGGLTAGFCYSLYYVWGKFFARHYTAANLFMLVLPVGFIALYPFVDFVHKTALAWLGIGALALMCTYGGYFCYYAGLRTLEAGRASITATLEPVIAAGVAFFWWGEYFSPVSYAGSGLILAAVVLMIRDEKSAAPERCAASAAEQPAGNESHEGTAAERA